jgi:hypothetical protein
LRRPRPGRWGRPVSLPLAPAARGLREDRPGIGSPVLRRPMTG